MYQILYLTYFSERKLANREAILAELERIGFQMSMVTYHIIHSLLLQIYVTPNYKIIDNPVYPDYLVPVLGKLSLRAPPFV